MQRNILLLCGGQSAEHEVSIRSARNILTALDSQKYKAHVVVISRSGCWQSLPSPSQLETITKVVETLPGIPACTLIRIQDKTYLMDENGHKQAIDLAFPVLHGPMGEDGTVQGMLEVMGLPYVGCGVLSSAICMDKLVSKQILESAKLPIAPYFAITQDDVMPTFQEAQQRLSSSIVFVKPSALGSSVGVSKVRTAEEWKVACQLAFEYGSNIVVEAMIEGREVECAVLESEEPKAYGVVEVKHNHDFYTYKAKYEPGESEMVIPAQLTAEETRQVEELAVRTFKALGCSGLARIDFFLNNSGQAIVSEANTIPGFTPTSPYLMLLEYFGVSRKEAINTLLELALKTFASKQGVSTDHLLKNERLAAVV